MVKLNAKILKVLWMVYHYKLYRKEFAALYPEQHVNWYEDTRRFYFGLDLPEGLDKSELDFERVMRFYPDEMPYKNWVETNEDALGKFVWKLNSYNLDVLV